MNWKQSLGRRKFYAILAASAVEMIVGMLSSLIDTAIAGHITGTIGLSAMNLVAPIMGFTVFTEGLFSVGASMVYAEYKGKYQEERAEAAFGTGLICTACTGLLTALAFIYIVPPYLTYMGVSDTIRQLVMDFLFFLYPQLALAPAYQLICQMVITDGGEVTGTAAGIVETVLNLVLSIILGLKMGIIGIGLGTLISTLGGLGIALLHFFDKRNSLRIRFGFDRGDIKKMFLFGANDSAMFFLMPVLSLVTTKFVLLRFGEFYLPVLTIIYAIFDITVIFEATGEAMRPIMPIYMGDRNIEAVKKMLDSSLWVNMLFSVVFALLLFLAGSYIPVVFDITDPVLLRECTYALRIYALACPGLALVTGFNSYYLNTGKPALAILESILCRLVCILIPAVPLGLILGIRGMMWGFVIAPYLTAVIWFGYIFLRYGKEQFPILLTPSGDVFFTRTTPLEQEDIMSLVYAVHGFLSDNNADKTSRTRAELMLEELLLLIWDTNLKFNKGRKPKEILAECCVRIGSDGIDMSIWDSGVIFDVTEADGDIVNFRSYFVERFLTGQKEKKHMTITSFNKNFCHFRFD